MNLLAFDLGAESGRAVLGTLDAGRLRVEEVHRFENRPIHADGHLYWDLPALWDHVKDGLRRAAAKVDVLHGVGVDTWGVDYALVSRDGRIIGRPLHYRDARTDGVMEAAMARVGRERIYDATGVQFMPFNTLFQLIAHARDDPAALAAADRLLFMPDVFRLLLSGAAHTEPTIASTSQMYDPRRHAWIDGLLEDLDVPRRLLPPIEPTGTMSQLRDDVARACGIESSCPVISIAGHDTASAVAAVPAAGDQTWCYISSGTWSLMGVELDEPVISADSMSHNFTNEVGVGRSVRFLRNIMGLWLVQECRRDFANWGAADQSYAQLTELAAHSRGCDAVVDPDYKPFLAPGDMCAKIERFCRETNQAPPRDEGETIRCCLEGLALTYRRTLERLEELTGKRIEVIHIVGGGSRNELLNQMTADACGRIVVAGPAEATAIGNLLVQAAALGAVDVPDAPDAAVALQCHGRQALAALRRIVADSFDVKRFEPIDPASWHAKYERFREVAGR